MFTHKFLISVVIIACCAIPASATLVTYTDPVSFASATTSDAFSNIDVTAGSLGNSFPDLGLDFSDPGGLTGSLTPPVGWPAGDTITADNTGETTITITFPSAVNAIELYVDDSLDNYVYFSIDDGSGPISPYVSIGTSGTPEFFGITTTSSFTSFTIMNEEPVGQLVIGDISIGTAGSGGPGDPSPTPEAATLLLVATGLFGMGYMRRRMPLRAAPQAAPQAARRGTVRTMSTGITPA